jgi:hypothetical protein
VAHRSEPLYRLLSYLMPNHTDSIMALDYAINCRLRYSSDPALGLREYSTRADVRHVRHLLPRVRGIGPKKLATIDPWLEPRSREPRHQCPVNAPYDAR